MKIEIDKITHFLACYSIAVTLGIVTHWWIGLVAAILIGALKELLDKWTGMGTPDWIDFLADVFGAEFGALLAFINLMINN